MPRGDFGGGLCRAGGAWGPSQLSTFCDSVFYTVPQGQGLVNWAALSQGQELKEDVCPLSVIN